MEFVLALVMVKPTKERLRRTKEIADELHTSAEDVLEYALDLNSEDLKLRMVLELLRHRRITVWRAVVCFGSLVVWEYICWEGCGVVGSEDR